MCTAISLGKYFGRNFDYYFNYNQIPVVTPRRFVYRKNDNGKHYALIGMALVNNGYPLYFDATNEKGLSMAALEYPAFCRYNKPLQGMKNIASYEIIPWVLSQCSDTCEVKKLIQDVNITDESFSDDLSAGPLHWIISDMNKTYTLEQSEDSLHLYENPACVLTNSPSFDVQMINLAQYTSLSAKNSTDFFSDKFSLNKYTNGTGAIGMPGDFSSVSRFVKACFIRANIIISDDDIENVCSFFRMLFSVAQIKGCVLSEKGIMQTYYSSCCDVEKGVYYYVNNNSWQINMVNMYDFDLNADCIKTLA